MTALSLALSIASALLAALAVRAYRHYRARIATRDHFRQLSLLLWYLAARAQAEADLERQRREPEPKSKEP